EHFAVLLQIRIAGAACLMAIFLLLRSPVGMRRPRELALLFVLAMAGMMHALALQTGGQTSLQYDRMNLLILGLAVFTTWSVRWAALACALVIGVYLVGSGLAGGITANHFFVQNLARMIAASTVTVGATAVRERLRWRAFRDHQALNEADAKRHESEQRYRLLVETAGSAIIMLAPDRRVLEFNREAEILYGRSRHELIG